MNDQKRVEELVHRIEPIVLRFLHRLEQRESPMISLSVGVNLAAGMLAGAVYRVERDGCDVEQFIQDFMKEVSLMYRQLSENITLN